MNDDLLVKYLAGDADEEERDRVDRWLQDEAHAEEYNRVERVWMESGRLGSAADIDEHAAWERFRQRIRQQAVPTRVIPLGKAGNPLPVPRGTHFRFLRVAAAFALLAAAGWLGWYLLQQYSRTTVELASGQEVKEVRLSDGSVVTLNKDSRLSYVRRFQDAARTVALTGEAFFDIAPAPGRPLVSHVNGWKLAVTGTSFNRKRRDGTTEVIVETGRVKVSSGLEEISLQPGEKSVSRGRNGALMKQRTRNVLYKYYRTNQFVCRATPLQELVDALNEAYQVQITIPDPGLRQLPITTVFENESLDHILEVIRDTFDITVHYEEKQILLRQ